MSVSTQDPTRTSVVTALRTALSCPVHGPPDPDWESVRRGWNLHVDQQPAAIVAPATVSDVQETVRTAAALGVPVTVQSNGHGATAATTGTVMVRAHRLRDLSIDVQTRRARVGAGVKWAHLVAALADSGLTGTPGSTDDLTVVGYHTGGGLPWFGRAYGPAARWVRAWQVVRADGELVEVTADSDPDLFWALGGGGGGLGVVTAVEIELLPAPPLVGGQLMWPADRAAQVLAAFADVTRSAPPELTLWLWLITFPPSEPFPPELHERSMVNLNVTFLGAEAEAEELLAPLRAVPGLEVDTVAPLPMSELSSVANEPTQPLPVLDWSHFVAELSTDFQRGLLEVNPPHPQTPMIACIRHLGGALRQELPTAVEPIAEEYLLFGFSLAGSAAQEETVRAHWRALERRLGAHLSHRTHLNMLGPDPDITRGLGPATLARLRRVKAAQDPHWVFRSHRPILP